MIAPDSVEDFMRREDAGGGLEAADSHPALSFGNQAVKPITTRFKRSMCTTMRWAD